jgi:hypothetical protein
MSDAPATADPAEDLLEADAGNADAAAAAAEGEQAAPQAPGDPGYAPPAIVPALDDEGGTKFLYGEQEFGSMADALEAQQADADAHSEASAEEEPDGEEPVEEDVEVEEEPEE